MASEEITAEINAAIEESLESEKVAGENQPEEKQENTEVGEFDVSIVGDMEESGEAGESKNSEAEEKNEETEEGEKSGDPSGEAEETDEVNDRSVSEAVAHGLSVSEARSFGSNSQLQNTIEIIKEQNRQALLAGTNEEKGELKPLTLPELDPEKYDKEVIESFRSLVDEANQNREDLARFYENQGQANEATQQAAGAELTRWFDRKCSELGKEYHTSIGEGKTSSLEEGSKELAIRDSIASRMSILSDGYIAQDLGQPSIDELFDSASRDVLHTEFMKVGEQRLKGKIEKRSGQILNRVGRGRENKESTPEQETAAILEEKFGL